MDFYEINPYTDKPDEFKLFQSVDQTSWATTEATIFENYNTPNSNFDMSSVYVNVDANCPWTDGKIWDTFDNTTGINETTYENGEVSLMPVLPNAISSTQPSHTLILGYGNYQNNKYYNYQSWFNPKQKIQKYQHSNIMYGNWNQIGTLKFGGQAIIAVPFLTVVDGSGRTQTIDLHTYLNNYFDTYTLIDYIAVRFFTFETSATTYAQGLHLPINRPHGSRWTSSQGFPYISMVPIIKNESVKYRQGSGIDLSEIEVSMFDTYVSTASSDNIRYESFIIFGATYNSNLKNVSGSVMTHVLSVDKLSSYYVNGNYIYAGRTDRNVLGSTKEAFREAIRSRVAYFGLFFTDRSALLYNNSANEWTTYDDLFSHEDMHCGIIDGSGTTHGEYTSGKKNYGQKQYGSKDLASDTNVIPITPGGGFSPDAKFNGSISLHTNSVYMRGFSSYVIPVSNFQSIISKLNSQIQSLAIAQDSDVFKDLYHFFLGNEPYKAILGAKMIPFGFNLLGTITTGEFPVYIGNWNSEINARAIALQTSTVNMYWGNKSVPKTFNCFLDYEPYTSLTLDLPYSSSIELPASIFVGHTLSVESAIDIFSNSISHYIFVDDILFTTAIGNCCFDMPIATYSGMQYANALWETRNSEVNNVFNTVSSVGGNVVAGLISSSIHPAGSATGSTNTQAQISYGLAGVSALQGIYNGVQLHTYEKALKPQPALLQMGAGNSNFANIQHPILIIQTPKYIDKYNESTFSKLNGFACHYVDYIKNFTGFTQIINPNLTFDAPTEVKIAIAQALAEGVIL